MHKNFTQLTGLVRVSATPAPIASEVPLMCQSSPSLKFPPRRGITKVSHHPRHIDHYTKNHRKETPKKSTFPVFEPGTTRVYYYYQTPFTPPQNTPFNRLGVARWLRVASDSADTIIPQRIYGKVRFRIGSPKSVSPSRRIATTSHGRRDV